MNIEPVAIFHCAKKFPQDAAKQACEDESAELGEIRFFPQMQFEQALHDIEGFSHLWVIFYFHYNREWKPMVLPPRGSKIKRGVFSTRAPYRPNPIGLSCVEIVEKKGLSLWVKCFDLLDQTPIFDVKPYLPYADSFPQAATGWLLTDELKKFQISFLPLAREQLEFLESAGILALRSFIFNQLQFEPLNKKKKKLTNIENSKAALCYRTWRVAFSILEDKISIYKIFSGYSPLQLENQEDPYYDKKIHSQFRLLWPQ